VNVKIQTCDGENGRICSEISFSGVAHDAVPFFETRVLSLLTVTTGLAVDVLAELFGHCTADFFPFVYNFLRRRRRMHGVFVSFDFIVTDMDDGVGACVAVTRSVSSRGQQSSNAPIGLSPT